MASSARRYQFGDYGLGANSFGNPPSNPAEALPAYLSFAGSWKYFTTFLDRKPRRHIYALRRITD